MRALGARLSELTSTAVTSRMVSTGKLVSSQVTNSALGPCAKRGPEEPDDPPVRITSPYRKLLDDQDGWEKRCCCVPVEIHSESF